MVLVRGDEEDDGRIRLHGAKWSWEAEVVRVLEGWRLVLGVEGMGGITVVRWRLRGIVGFDMYIVKGEVWQTLPNSPGGRHLRESRWVLSTRVETTFPIFNFCVL